jgi:L-asparaginase/Glu-tRNA(Gln) amidotransferase subunit D
VVAGFGGGTMPDNLNRIVTETANYGCTVVVSSRVSKVTVLAETMTSVKSKKVFPSGLLNPQKSALLLSLALDANLDALGISELFNVFAIQ